MSLKETGRAVADLVAVYLEIALADGARADDPRLFALFDRMTPQEVQRVKEGLIAECVRSLPPPDTGAPVLDVCDLYLEHVRRGARPDDPRLHMLMHAMSDDECERAKAAIRELWLQAEPRPARPN
jgi:hypothetical protein